MTFLQARDLFEFWKSVPPTCESAAKFLQAYTTWEPGGPPRSEEEAQAAHRRSLEQRWKAGAMNPQQLVALMGGAGPAVAFGTNGIAQMPVGPIPGAPHTDGRQ